MGYGFPPGAASTLDDEFRERLRRGRLSGTMGAIRAARGWGRMGGDSGWLRKLWQGGLLVLVSVGVPAAAVGRSAQLREHPLFAFWLLLVYEAVVASAAFIGAVVRDLRERWV